MKKFTAMLLSLTMFFTITGCSSQNSEARTVTEGTTTTAVNTNTTATTTTPAVTTTTPAITTQATTESTLTTTTEVETTTTKAPSRPDVEVTSTNSATIVVNNENGFVSLNVQKVTQSPEFITGTAIASATSVLNYYGFGCTKTELLEYMPIMKKADENGLWESPEDYFLGDPTDENLGYCSPSVLKKTITSYWEAHNISNFEVIDLSGSKFRDLYSEINEGNPVIIWVGAAMFTTDFGAQELPLKNGESFNYLPITQCMVMTGYKNGDEVIVSNSHIPETEFDKYSESDSLGSYEMMGSKALVIHKIQ